MWPELTVYIFTQTRCAKCKNSLYIYRPFIHLQIEKFQKLLLSNIAMQHQLMSGFQQQLCLVALIICIMNIKDIKIKYFC